MVICVPCFVWGLPRNTATTSRRAPMLTPLSLPTLGDSEGAKQMTWKKCGKRHCSAFSRQCWRNGEMFCQPIYPFSDGLNRKANILNKFKLEL